MLKIMNHVQQVKVQLEPEFSAISKALTKGDLAQARTIRSKCDSILEDSFANLKNCLISGKDNKPAFFLFNFRNFNEPIFEMIVGNCFTNPKEVTELSKKITELFTSPKAVDEEIAKAQRKIIAYQEAQRLAEEERYDQETGALFLEQCKLAKQCKALLEEERLSQITTQNSTSSRYVGDFIPTDCEKLAQNLMQQIEVGERVVEKPLLTARAAIDTFYRGIRLSDNKEKAAGIRAGQAVIQTLTDTRNNLLAIATVFSGYRTETSHDILHQLIINPRRLHIASALSGLNRSVADTLNDGIDFTKSLLDLNLMISNVKPYVRGSF